MAVTGKWNSLLPKARKQAADMAVDQDPCTWQRSHFRPII
ncbi:hypothetical protein D3OALGA1CA_3826 [Olavius algarvensis associated proteobacterium Delta 3]|nr:hypothetical protein D3OALGA1CA_3826 [Olavius algarvensis associated proteobacterium Delta 3]CAB5150658.1 hypothetical protein D3OALGB2SA_4785 [Olavius algarvensis associated proteobacterium Delta 3]